MRIIHHNKRPISDPQSIAIFLCGTLYLAFFLISLKTGFHLYRNLHFTSDGFHYYSAIRNFSLWGSLWEGPTFEHILGNHCYLTMFFLAPLVRIFQSPYVLVFINICTHFATSLILYFCGREVFRGKKNGSLTAALVSLLYVLFPGVVRGYFCDSYMFQPDFLLSPFLSLFFLFALRGNEFGLLLTTVLIVLTKEEYVVLFPAFGIVIFFMVWALQNRGFSYKFFWKQIAVYISSSAISVFILFSFRAENQIHHAVRAGFALVRLSFLSTYEDAWNFSSKYLLPICAFLVLSIFSLKTERFKKAAVLLILTLIPFARALLNSIVYGDANGTPWGNAAISPLIFISLLSLLSLFLTDLYARKMDSATGLVICVSLIISIVSSSRITAVNWMMQALMDKIPSSFDLNEVEIIRSAVPQAKAIGYNITTEFLMAPFMDRSHVVDSWLTLKDQDFQKKVLLKADYLILPKNSSLIPVIQSDPHLFSLVVETPSLICFRPLR